MKFPINPKFSVIALLAFGLLSNNTYADDQTTGATKTSTTTTATTDSGAAYLASHKKLPGVKTTADGLQYKVVRLGTGPKPTDSDVVSVNYSGKLLDGTEFDSSYKRGEPASFPVNGVIPGWTEALKLMPVGSEYELVIPAELAYGAAGAPPSIGPNQVLVFKVELLKIES
jgi:FKBP-type peptidyl-prolyl cis-trans isomerase